MRKTIITNFVMFLIVLSIGYALEAPSEYWGELRINSELVPDGTLVEARINGDVYDTFSTISGYYDLIVPGDNPNTGGIEIGSPGTPIEVFVDGKQTSQNLVWIPGSSDRIDLNVIIPQPPEIAGLPDITFNEDESTNIDLDDYVEDPDNTDAELTWTYSGNTNINVNLDSSTHVAIFTSSTDWSGEEMIIFTATDPDNLNDSDDVTVSVVPVNDAPVITSLPAVIAFEDSFYSYDVEATDVEDDSLTYSLETSPTGMTINSANGVIEWTPSQDDIGGHPINISVTDGDLYNYQTYTLTVNSFNDGPVISYIPDVIFDEDESDNIDLDDYVEDPDNTDSEITWEYFGNININIEVDDITHVATFTTEQDWNGEETLTFTATDLGGMNDSVNTTVIVMPVNDAPIITSTPITAAIENIQYTYDVETTDVDDDLLTYSLITSPAWMTIDSSTGLIEWIPSQDDIGSHPINISVTDGDLYDYQIYTLTVNAVNDAPVVSYIPDVFFDEDGSDNIDLDDYVEDPDNNDSEITWTYSGNININIEVDDITHVATFTTEQDWNGDEIIIFTATDPDGLNDSDDTTITVLSVNDAPVITSIPVTTAIENTQYTYDVEATDIEDDLLTYSLETSPAGMTIDSNGLIEWLPLNQDSGNHDINISVNDGDLYDYQFYTLTVQDVNAPPVLEQMDDITVDEGEEVVITAVGSDPDGGNLFYSINDSGFSQDDNVFTWQTDYDDARVYNVLVTVSDGYLNDSQAVTITVNNENGPPVLEQIDDITVDENEEVVITAIGSDPDDDDLVYFIDDSR
ncbi:putative Ig domain-containing protein, partial [Candidatus Woesearchaeota archaeon]|nr:putative Ig domain-containing protein [Candidatus Woesearchaeota archaeon]